MGGGGMVGSWFWQHKSVINKEQNKHTGKNKEGDAPGQLYIARNTFEFAFYFVF